MIKDPFIWNPIMEDDLKKIASRTESPNDRMVAWKLALKEALSGTVHFSSSLFLLFSSLASYIELEEIKVNIILKQSRK